MGQLIEVESTRVGHVALFDTDRSITGQDGSGFGPAAAATVDASDIPGSLAARIFDAVEGIDHVFVASNQVVVRRPSGWDPDTLGRVAGVIRDFFVFYPTA